ncbi:MAG: FUSC family protein [Solirubrobacterales bacterium]|nr:FUSC family protein [Solirubrobacterales bacterium]
MRDRVEVVRRNALTIAQVGVSAGVAWLVARELLGHEQPFFAAVAAILTLSLAIGQRGRRAVEVALGVALGIGVADLIVLVIGTGAWQLVVVVSLAMAVALLLGGGTLLVNQAAVSAVLVVTLQPPTDGITAARFLDAVIGGAVALLANAITPTHPVRLVRRELEPLVRELAATLIDIADALAGGDTAAAQEALERGRSIDPLLARFREAVMVADETIRYSPPRRRSRRHVRYLSEAQAPLDHAVRNTRVLARGAVRATELGERVPPLAIEAIRDLAGAVGEIFDFLSDPADGSATERAALSAASKATEALQETGNLSVSVIVGQVRSTAVDLLEGLGLEADAARQAIRAPGQGGIG